MIELRASVPDDLLFLAEEEGGAEARVGHESPASFLHDRVLKANGERPVYCGGLCAATADGVVHETETQSEDGAECFADSRGL